MSIMFKVYEYSMYNWPLLHIQPCMSHQPIPPSTIEGENQSISVVELTKPGVDLGRGINVLQDLTSNPSYRVRLTQYQFGQMVTQRFLERSRHQWKTRPVRESKTKDSGFACSYNSTPSFLHLTFWYSPLAYSLFLSLSLTPSSHPSPPCSLWQSIWPTQPCHPFNLSVLAMATITHWLAFVAEQAGPGVGAFVPSLRAFGIISRDRQVTEATPQWEGRWVGPPGTERSSLVRKSSRNLNLLHCNWVT